MHPTPRHRQNLITRHVDTQKASIVEFGALNSPTFKPSEYNVKFIDYTNREGLIRDNLSNPLIKSESIVHVDYPTEEPIYDWIPEKFDLAIANHVIEHIPDMISWLQQVYEILKPGGIFFLSIPDRRYTFDYLKRESDIVDILQSYFTKQKRPSAANLFQHYFYRRPVSAAQCWNGDAQEICGKPGMSIKDAFFNAVRAAKVYTSTHCHIFTTSSFQTIIALLKELELIKFDVKAIYDVDRDANEFYIFLQRPTNQ